LPTTLRALGQALHGEVHEWRREWRREAAGRGAAGGAGRGERRREGERTGLLVLAERHRGVAGWRRRLAELAAFAAEFAAVPAVSCVLGVRARGPHCAAEATSALLSLLLARCEWHEACGGEAVGGEGGVGDGRGLYFVWLRILVRCLLAYARVLGGWVERGRAAAGGGRLKSEQHVFHSCGCEPGELRDAAGELFVYRAGAHADPALGAGGGDSAAGWEGAFALRPAGCVPLFLAPLAPSILVCGKSRRLVGSLAGGAAAGARGREEGAGEGTEEGTEKGTEEGEEELEMRVSERLLALLASRRAAAASCRGGAAAAGEERRRDGVQAEGEPAPVPGLAGDSAAAGRHWLEQMPHWGSMPRKDDVPMAFARPAEHGYPVVCRAARPSPRPHSWLPGW